VHRDRGRESPIYLTDWIYWFTLLDTDLCRVEAIVQIEGAWLQFARPSQVVQTCDASRVGYTIRAVEELTLRGASSAVGFLTYEAGAAFGFQIHVSSDLPLAWFAVFDTQPLRLDNLSQWCRSDPASLHRYRRSSAWATA
jgi:hypothetical protein